MLVIRTIIAYHFLSLAFAASYLPILKIFHFDRVDGVCRGEKMSIIVNLRIAKQERNVVYFNATSNVTEDADANAKGITTITRCSSKENLDTCEVFYTSFHDNYCDIVNPSIPSLSPFYIKYTPSYTCPIKKGIYRAFNSKVDFSTFLIFPLGDWYWKSRTVFRDPKTNKTIACLKVEGYGGH